MKIIDRIGNAIKEGQLLFWVSTGLRARVTKMERGGLTTVDSGRTPARVTLEVIFEIPYDHKLPAFGLGDFVVAQDPVETAKVDALIDSVSQRPQ
jgi:hypothetical protein